ncbi:hypothetical protein BGZ70_004784 [Mortierella alpina]|uniref:Major facilitator superfamily (MFS) profile domain-containing protein n=1 Tax=Mortierella alpina TaxID=64518 RepID=A0A9P6J9L4_MORAP|nr:hypothetical protein BGZ70_004784 [Mortierella alpina]
MTISSPDGDSGQQPPKGYDMTKVVSVSGSAHTIAKEDPEKGPTPPYYDTALEAETSSLIDVDPVAIKKLKAKIDRRLVPLVSMLYLCAFLDRVNIGNAKVGGLEADLQLTPSEYNWSLSIFFIGYVIFEVPSNMCLKVIGPRFWLSLVMVSWGGIMMCMAAVQSATGLLIARFFLGVAESGLFPGVVYLFSLWYTRDEQAIRNGFFFSTATLAGAFGGALAYGIQQMDGIHGLHGWQWIFLLEGLPTVLLTSVVLWLLPDFPHNAKFLTQEERDLTVMRLKIDAGPANQTGFSWREFRMVFKDYKTYLHMMMYILSTIPLYSLAFFLPSIVLGFNLEPLETQLLTVPAYLIACVCTLLCAFSSDYHKERGLHFAIPTGTACLGYILLIWSRESSTAVRYVCLTITTIGNFSAVPPMVSWFTSNIGGHTKRGVATGAIIAFGNIGGAIGGQVYREADAANGYVRGHALCAGLLGFSVCLILTTKFLLTRENRRRNRLTPEEFAREAEGEDLCDNHPAWRYWT